MPVRVKPSWNMFIPTAYKISNNWAKNFWAKTFRANDDKIKEFEKYLKNKNAIKFDVIYQPKKEYKLRVKKLRIFRNKSKKVRHIFARAITGVFSAISPERILPAFNSNFNKPEPFALDKFYIPQEINTNLQYVLEEVVKVEKYKYLEAFYISFILFTIDMLKVGAKFYDIIEFASNDSFYLFNIVFEKCINDYIYTEIEAFNDEKKMPSGIVRFMNKTKDGRIDVKEVELDAFLENVIENFREYVKERSNGEEHNFSEQTKKIMKQIILYSIGVFTFHYISQFIDFNSFYKENSLYREIETHFVYKEWEKVLNIRTRAKTIRVRVLNDNFLNYICSIDRERGDSIAVFRDGDKFRTIIIPSKSEDVCVEYMANTDKNFLLLVGLGGCSGGEKSFIVRFPASIEHLIDILKLLTSGEYHKDFIYKLASYF